MPKSIRFRFLALSALLSLCPAITAQAPAPTPNFSPIQPIAFDTTGPVIRAHSEALKPFTVAGERGVLLGQQDGAFEAWLLPVKVLSHVTIEASVGGYSVPIDVNQQSAEIEVRPDRTVITYAHIAFTVRQIMFAPLDEQGFEQSFQRGDLLADCRLGDVVNLRGFGKTFRFGQITKNFKTFDLHKNKEYRFWRFRQLMFKLASNLEGNNLMA